MVTAPNTTALGAYFLKAPKDSAFGKVFLNNMDSNSFSSDMEKNAMEKLIALMLSNSKTAMYNIHDTISAMQEYRNCQVGKKLKHL